MGLKFKAGDIIECGFHKWLIVNKKDSDYCAILIFLRKANNNLYRIGDVEKLSGYIVDKYYRLANEI